MDGFVQRLRPGRAGLLRRRRGALHQPVGPRLPAGVPPAARCCARRFPASPCTPTRRPRRRRCGATSSPSCACAIPRCSSARSTGRTSSTACARAPIGWARCWPPSTGIATRPASSTASAATEVDELTAALTRRGLKALRYHAGLADEERRANQDAFINERVDIVVATVAFGMGIDRSNVRYVIHAGMPKSLEHYQQETGRAGRDGLEAECLLLVSGGDYGLWKSILTPEGDRAAAGRAAQARRDVRVLPAGRLPPPRAGDVLRPELRARELRRLRRLPRPRPWPATTPARSRRRSSRRWPSCAGGSAPRTWPTCWPAPRRRASVSCATTGWPATAALRDDKQGQVRALDRSAHRPRILERTDDEYPTLKLTARGARGAARRGDGARAHARAGGEGDRRRHGVRAGGRVDEGRRLRAGRRSEPVAHDPLLFERLRIAAAHDRRGARRAALPDLQRRLAARHGRGATPPRRGSSSRSRASASGRARRSASGSSRCSASPPPETAGGSASGAVGRAM